jgi:acyl-coenzyme A thioesterase PaaI-like protein
MNAVQWQLARAAFHRDDARLSFPPMTPQQQSFASIGCFVCGSADANPSGLHLVFEETPKGAATSFCLAPAFESYPGYLHGGIVSAVLDETMGYVGVFKRQSLPFTRRLELQFRLGLKGGRKYRCEAELMATGEAGYQARATIRDERGRLLVSASGDFVQPSRSMAARMLPEAAERFASFFPE